MRIRSGSVPSVSQWADSVAFSASKGPWPIGNQLTASACRAASRSVRRGPIPPTRISGWGSDRHCGEFNVSASW